MQTQAIKTLTPTAPQVQSPTKSRRLTAIDIVRGWAMIAMLIAHSAWRIPGFDYRVVFGWDKIGELPNWSALETYMAYALHIATPTFFLLAGFSIAFFVTSRQRRGWTEWEITRFLLIRGGVLVFLDLFVLAWDVYPSFEYNPNNYILLTIGLVIWILAFVRRLPVRYIIAIAVGTMFAMQVLYYVTPVPGDTNLVRSLLFYNSPTDPFSIHFPVLAWFSVMTLGFLSGLFIRQHPDKLQWFTLRAAAVLLGLWVLTILFNDFGRIYREHPFVFTKHPPALDYLLLYVGLAYVLVYLQSKLTAFENWLPFHVLTVFGQTALFYFALHTYVLAAVGLVITRLPLEPIATSLLLSLVAGIVMYFACYFYRRIKRAHPDSVLKYF